MNKSSTPALLVPLLALLAIVFPFATSPRSSGSPGGKNPQAGKPAGQQAKQTCTAPVCPHTAAKLIEDFLHARLHQEELPQGDLRNKYSLHFMIATLPDPVDSRLPYFFDSFVASIQRAFEASGYVLDRFDLAWPRPGAASTTKTTDVTRYRRDPSLLLFRKPATDTDTAERKLFLVFIVGETPTGGLHQAAMASALRQLARFFPWGTGYDTLPEELHRLTQTNPGTTVEILGPTFSGSAISLDFALRDWLEKLQAGEAKRRKPVITFRIVSGTATAIDPDDFSKKDFPQIGSSSAFQAVVPPDKDAFQRIFSYIHNLGYEKVALLLEANTAYGRQKITSKLLKLPFPLHISQLRTASEKQRLAQQKLNSNSAPFVNSPRELPLPAGETSQPKEILPSFSNLGVPSADLVLSRLLSTISHEGYHAVGILATDVRDTIFLAREIHQHCPGTLVFTVNADLLYMHPDVITSTRGMLVFTPYPLFNLNQVWTRRSPGSDHRLQFPSQAAEGVYNATLDLLELEHEQEERQEPKKKERKEEKKEKEETATSNEEQKPEELILDYGGPFPSRDSEGSKKPKAEEPALWVTVVGRNGPLPVKLLSWKDSENYSVSLPRPPQNNSPTVDQEGIYTPNSALGIALLSVILFFFSLMIILQYRSPASLERASRLFGEPITPEYREQARLFLIACLVCPLSFYIVVTAVYSLPAIALYKLYGVFAVRGWWWLLVLTAVLLSLAGATAVVFRAFRKERRQDSVLRGVVKSVVLFGCILVLVFTLRLAAVWLRAAWAKKPEAIFTYVRAFDYSSGLSPLVPLFCLALAGFLWAFCSLLRLRMIDGMRVPGGEDPGDRCLLKADKPSFRGVITLENKVRERLEKASAFSTGWYIGIIFVVLLAAVLYLSFPFVWPYEGREFYLLFASGFLFVYGALTTEFGRLWLVWAALRRLLHRLASHPMQAAYQRYRNSFPGLPRIDLAVPLQTFTVLSFSVDQAERLLRLASCLVSSPALFGNATASSAVTSSASPGTVGENLKRWIPQAETEVRKAAVNLSKALKYDAKGKWRLAIQKRSRCQQALGNLYQTTAKLLEPSWRPKTTSALPAKETPEFQAFRELGEEFLAGRTVLLLSYVLPPLRNLGALILAGLLLMLFSVISYPFLQRNHFLAFNWIVILGFVGVALLVMLQMERDVVLSALNGTVPGKVTVTRHFTFRVLTYVMIPILALLGAQFPDTVGRIVSWFSSTPGH